MNRTWCDIETLQARASDVEPAQFGLIVPGFVLVGIPTEPGHLIQNRPKDTSTMMFSIHPEQGLSRTAEPLRYMHVVQSNPRSKDPWLTVGRTWENDLMVNDYTVSRAHARMRHAPNHFGYWLEDLGSTNGTWVNEEKIHPQRQILLKTQDIVRLGRQNLILLAPWDFCRLLQQMD